LFTVVIWKYSSRSGTAETNIPAKLERCIAANAGSPENLKQSHYLSKTYPIKPFALRGFVWLAIQV
jgi:hypothetical protein